MTKLRPGRKRRVWFCPRSVTYEVSERYSVCIYKYKGTTIVRHIDRAHNDPIGLHVEDAEFLHQLDTYTRHPT